MFLQHEIQIRVRYQETDAQGRVHHGNYATYFEMGRVELLRNAGYSYRKLEEEGVLLVIAEFTCRYHQPAFYDDLLRLQTTVVRSKGVRIEHEYKIFRDDDLLCAGRTVCACIDRGGKVRRLPDWLRID